MDKKRLILPSGFILFLSMGSVFVSWGQPSPTEPAGRGRGGGPQEPSAQEVPRTMFISGTVVLEGESPLPAPAKVQLICEGAVRQVVQTSQDGHFSFTLGSNKPNAATMDPSIGGANYPAIQSPRLSGSERRDPFRTSGVGRMMPFNRVDLSACECRASLPGYKGSPIRLGYRSFFDSPDLGVITLSPLEHVSGTTVSLNTLNAPKKALDSFEKAGKELRKEKTDYSKVRRHLEKATSIYPEFAAAWQLLGQTQVILGNRQEARSAFQQALAVDPKYVTPYISLGELAIQDHQWEESARLTARAIELNPYVTSAHYFHAVAQYYMKRDDLAEQAIRKVQESDEAALYPASHYLLGGIYADRGEFEAAAVELRRFLATRPHEKLVEEVEMRLNDWQQRGLIVPSQGQEDTQVADN